VSPFWFFGLALRGFAIYQLLGPYPEKSVTVDVEGRRYRVTRWKPGDKAEGTVYQVERIENGQPTARFMFDDSFGGEVGPLSRSGEPVKVAELVADMARFPPDIFK